jgi:hypothetical protein
VTNSGPSSPNQPWREPIQITLMGYLPPSENAMRCAHWSDKHREKRRALLALRQALELEAGIESLSESSASGHQIGITSGSRKFRTAFGTLDSYLAMHGISLKAASCLRRYTHKRKKKQSLK